MRPEYEEPRQIGYDTYGRPVYASPQRMRVGPPACHHDHQAPVQRQSGGAAKWVGIGVGGSMLAISIAVSAVAVAISAVALTCCLIVLRSMWRDYQKGR